MMSGRLPIAVLAALLMTAPAAAQSVSEPRNGSALRLVPRDSTLTPQRQGFQLPVTDYVDERGIVQTRRGILFGKEMDANTLVGIGVFDRGTRAPSFTSERDPTATPRKSRGVAVGLKMRF